MPGRSFLWWLVGGIASLAVVIGALVVLRAPLVHIAVRAVAHRLDIPIRNLDVIRVGLDGLSLGDVAVGDEAGPTARSVDISWTPKSLALGRAVGIRVDAPSVAMTFADGRFSVDGLRLPDTQRAGGGAPFDRLDIVSARIAIATPWGAARGLGDAGLISGAEGVAAARIDLATGSLDLAGGTLSLSDARFEPNKPFETRLKVDGVDLQALLTLIDVAGLKGSGSIAGEIPIHIDADGVRIANGRLAAQGQGRLGYAGDALPSDIPGLDRQAGDDMALARAALADFRYTSLAFGLDRAASGEGTVVVRLEGANPNVLDNQPFVLNIRLDANFDTLAEILLDGYATAGQLLRNASAR